MDRGHDQMQSSLSSTACVSSLRDGMRTAMMLVTVHGLYDIPRPLTEIDSLTDVLELVLWPRAKCYYDDRRVVILELPEEVIAFPPSSILYRDRRLVVDFDSTMTVNVSKDKDGTAVSPRPSQQLRAASARSISHTNSASSVAMQAAYHHVSGSAVTAPVAVGGSSPEGFLQPTNCSSDNGFMADAASPADGPASNGNSGGRSNCLNKFGGSTTKINNKIMLMCPTHDKLKIVVDVIVGIRQRKKCSTNGYRWLTPVNTFEQFGNAMDAASETSNNFAFQGIGNMNLNDGYGTFTFAEREVLRHKFVERHVGTRVGRLSVTISTPHLHEDLNKAKYYHENGQPYYMDAISMAAETPRSGGSGMPEARSLFASNNNYRELAHLQLAEEVNRLNSNEASLALYHRRLLINAAERLQSDAVFLSKSFETQKTNIVGHAYLMREGTHDRIVESLYQGESEFSVYRRLRLACNPSFYSRRLENLFEDYPPSPEALAALKTAAPRSSLLPSSTSVDPGGLAPSIDVAPDVPHAAVMGHLLHAFYGREDEMMRLVCLELGPERSATGARTRYSMYARHHHITEEKLSSFCPVIDKSMRERDVLDYDPDYYMYLMVNHFKKPELLPTEFNYAPITYSSDDRPLFSASLSFPENKGPEDGFPVNSRNGGTRGSTSGGSTASNFRDRAIVARASRVPLLMTAVERPLVPQDPASRRTSEIDILLEKYKGEFVQIVPSVADGTKRVLQGMERIWNSRSARHKARVEPLFRVYADSNAFGGGNFVEATFYDFLMRLCEFTYISPASLVAALIYMDRLMIRYPYLCLLRSTVQRLFIVMVRIASKVVDLRSVNNKNFAHVFQISTSDMNFLEERMLKLMDFDFFLAPEEFVAYAHMLDPPSTSTPGRRPPVPVQNFDDGDSHSRAAIESAPKAPEHQSAPSVAPPVRPSRNSTTNNCNGSVTGTLNSGGYASNNSRSSNSCSSQQPNRPVAMVSGGEVDITTAYPSRTDKVRTAQLGVAGYPHEAGRS